MIQLYSAEIGEERRLFLVKMTAAFPYLLRNHIRPGCLCESPEGISEKNRLIIQGTVEAPLDTRFEGDKACRKSRSLGRASEQVCWVDRTQLPWSLFNVGPLEKLARAKNRPLWVCDCLGKAIMGIPYGPNYTSRERLTMLGYVGKLTDALGQCERIHQTAVPLNYARHSLRSLTLWLFTLPFALVKDMGLLTAPVTACIAWLLYGIYQIGYSIEDPFQGSLRLSILCDAIRNDVLGVMENSRESAYTLEDGWDDYHAGQFKDQTLSYENIVPPVTNDAVASLLHGTNSFNGHRLSIGGDTRRRDLDELILR